AWARVAARSRRRTRFRTTAPPTGRPTAYATRGGSVTGPTTAQLTITSPRRRRRPRASARNIDRSRIGQIRPTGGRGSWPADAGARRDRLSSASADGSRASCSAGDCSVGTSSSRMASSNARATRGAGRAAPSEATWNTRFQGVHALDLRDDTLSLGVPSSVTIERLRTSYHGLLTDAAQALTGVPLDISLLVDTTPRQEEFVSLEQLPSPIHANGADDTRRVEEPNAQGWIATSLNPRYTFDQFVIGASNRFAHAAAMSVAER